MDGKLLPAFPCVAHDGGLADIEHLLDHVELAERVVPVLLGESLDEFGVLVPHVLDVAQPVVDEAEASVRERGEHAAAAVVADDHDVLYPDHVGGELHHGKAVQIRMDDEVGDVAVDENLAGHEARDLVRRHTRVRTADPQVLGALDSRETGEKIRLPAFDVVRPCAVVCEQVIQVGHKRIVKACKSGGGNCGVMVPFEPRRDTKEHEWSEEASAWPRSPLRNPIRVHSWSQPIFAVPIVRPFCLASHHGNRLQF